ncbi:transposase [Bhargavaea ullalensis]|uniref:Transposase n=3 Tax=Bhargavaea ullalensis TaxID=1265685 RepID=A0ABV2GFD6_9BACL
MNSIMYLPGLKEVIITGIEEQEDRLVLHAELEVRIHACPSCGSRTRKVHDYRVRKVGHLKLFERLTTIFYRQRRYACQKCRKRFSEKNPIVGRYQRFTKEWNQAVSLRCVKAKTFKEMAVSFGASATTITRRFDGLAEKEMTSPGKLPKAIAIDEYKGDTSAGKYQVIIADAATRQPIDVLPDRKVETVKSYLQQHGGAVEVVVMDMSYTFKSAVKKALGNPVIVADRFHFVRYVHWALERIRVRVQKEFSEYDRKKCKRMRHVFHKQSDQLTEKQKWYLDRYLNMHPSLRKAYELKEAFKKWFNDAKTAGLDGIAEIKQELQGFYELIEESGLEEFRKTRDTLRNWQVEILNSFAFGYSNGFLEAINNTTKVLKRNAYGYRNFDRMRARILLKWKYRELEIHVA